MSETEHSYYVTVDEAEEPPKVLRIADYSSLAQAHSIQYSHEQFMVSVGQSTRGLGAIRTYPLAEAESRWPAQVAAYIAGIRYYTVSMSGEQRSPERVGLRPLNSADTGGAA